MSKITNQEFLTAIFGEEAAWCHVTSHPHPPDAVPPERRLAAWAGDYYSRFTLQPGTNQYFTISLFYADEKQKARRRKALFRSTPVIVLDDVREKLSIDAARTLPRPSWVLETSQGSEQWGYILDAPCTSRSAVDNLLDGLVANGLAPDGTDPGMKGVTRYVRLPEGVNNKESKLVNGAPWQCRMLTWEPFNRVSIESLAEPFAVDLHALRRESRVDGAAAVSDHPLINIPEILHIKEVRSDGRFDIVCPWLGNHTGADDSGSAIFTNADGSIGFKCHHGSCESRTGRDLLEYVDAQSPGFSTSLKHWQVMRSFAEVASVSFLGEPAPPPAETLAPVSFLGEPAPTPAPPVIDAANPIQSLCDQLRRERPSTPEARSLAQGILKHVDDLPKIEQKHWHATVCDLMEWSKSDFYDIIKDLRRAWYGERVSRAEFYNKVVFVRELNQFYDHESRIFFTPEAFQNSFSDEDAEAKKIALQDGRVLKVDRLDYAPKMPVTFVERGVHYANTWSDRTQSTGSPGDVARWIDHFDAMGWGEHRNHMLCWMAFTLRYPETKINHMLLLGSGEGCGKDFLLYPLIRAMDNNCNTISGEDLLDGFNEYLLSTKYVHVNEAELGDRRESQAVYTKLKPLAAAPPETLMVNQKGIKRIKLRNIVNASMTANTLLPIRINGPSRRFFAVWSDLNPRDEDDNMMPEWVEYWNDRWGWMKSTGWEHVVHYLIHEVDLSKFNPATPPPVTEYLREIKEVSKSPMQQTIDNFIRKRHGAFECEILTAGDMSDTMRVGMLEPTDMLVDPKYFTPKRIGMMMREQGIPLVRHGNAKLWILRNRMKYAGMTSTAIYNEYQMQLKEMRGASSLSIVK